MRLKSTKTLVCPECHHMFIALPKERRRRFCSRACAYRFRIQPITARFWSFVEKSTEADGCWLWRGGTAGAGYGVFFLERNSETGNNRQVYAHRFAWEMANGPMPDGLFALHHCDTPNCVRNDGGHAHVYAGTLADNVRDMKARKRDRFHFAVHPPRGELSAHARLTSADVLAIRELLAMRVRQVDIAQQFGIEQTCVSKIKRRASWTHI